MLAMLFYCFASIASKQEFGGVIVDKKYNEISRFSFTGEEIQTNKGAVSQQLRPLAHLVTASLDSKAEFARLFGERENSKVLADFSPDSFATLYSRAHKKARGTKSGAVWDALRLASVFRELGLIASDEPEMLPSAEQQLIIEASVGHNVIVDAVAGSGKTTTVIGIIERAQLNEERVLMVTYNRKLKDETIKRLGYEGCVYTYHGLATFLGHELIKNDESLCYFLARELEPLSCDLLVIDEAQDMTPILYQTVRKIMSAAVAPPRLVLLGDRMQCIYKFAEANPRFLTCADQLFLGCAPKPWTRLTLTNCYRFGSTISNFVNIGILGGKTRLIGCGQTHGEVSYVVDNIFGDQFLERIYDLVKDNPNTWMVLAPYLFSKSAGVVSIVSKLTDYLSNRGVLCYIPFGSKSTKSLTHDKLLFLTYARAKGLERDNVIVLNFDDGLAALQKRISKVVTEDVYVACTRARSRLVLVRHFSNPVQQFLDLSCSLPYYEKRAYRSIVPGKAPPFAGSLTNLYQDRLVSNGHRVWDMIPSTSYRLVYSTNLIIPELSTTAKSISSVLLEDVTDINHFVIVFSLITVPLAKPSQIMTKAIDQWSREKQTKYLKRQLLKPYTWINAHEVQLIHNATQGVLGHLGIKNDQLNITSQFVLDYTFDSVKYRITLGSHVVVAEKVVVVIFAGFHEKNQILICMLHWLLHGPDVAVYGFSGYDGQLFHYVPTGNEPLVLDQLIRFTSPLTESESNFISRMLTLEPIRCATGGKDV